MSSADEYQRWTVTVERNLRDDVSRVAYQFDEDSRNDIVSNVVVNLLSQLKSGKLFDSEEGMLRYARTCLTNETITRLRRKKRSQVTQLSDEVDPIAARPLEDLQLKLEWNPTLSKCFELLDEFSQIVFYKFHVARNGYGQIAIELKDARIAAGRSITPKALKTRNSRTKANLLECFLKSGITPNDYSSFKNQFR